MSFTQTADSSEVIPTKGCRKSYLDHVLHSFNTNGIDPVIVQHALEYQRVDVILATICFILEQEHQLNHSSMAGKTGSFLSMRDALGVNQGYVTVSPRHWAYHNLVSADFSYEMLDIFRILRQRTNWTSQEFEEACLNSPAHAKFNYLCEISSFNQARQQAVGYVFSLIINNPYDQIYRWFIPKREDIPSMAALVYPLKSSSSSSPSNSEEGLTLNDFPTIQRYTQWATHASDSIAVITFALSRCPDYSSYEQFLLEPRHAHNFAYEDDILNIFGGLYNPAFNPPIQHQPITRNDQLFPYLPLGFTQPHGDTVLEHLILDAQKDSSPQKHTSISSDGSKISHSSGTHSSNVQTSPDETLRSDQSKSDMFPQDKTLYDDYSIIITSQRPHPVPRLDGPCHNAQLVTSTEALRDSAAISFPVPHTAALMHYIHRGYIIRLWLLTSRLTYLFQITKQLQTKFDSSKVTTMRQTLLLSDKPRGVIDQYNTYVKHMKSIHHHHHLLQQQQQQQQQQKHQQDIDPPSAMELAYDPESVQIYRLLRRQMLLQHENDTMIYRIKSILRTIPPYFLPTTLIVQTYVLAKYMNDDELASICSSLEGFTLQQASPFHIFRHGLHSSVSGLKDLSASPLTTDPISDIHESIPRLWPCSSEWCKTPEQRDLICSLNLFNAITPVNCSWYFSFFHMFAGRNNIPLLEFACNLILNQQGYGTDDMKNDMTKFLSLAQDELQLYTDLITSNNYESDMIEYQQLTLSQRRTRPQPQKQKLKTNLLSILLRETAVNVNTVKYLIKHKCKLISNSSSGEENNCFLACLQTRAPPSLVLPVLEYFWEFTQRNKAFKPAVSPSELLNVIFKLGTNFQSSDDIWEHCDGLADTTRLPPSQTSSNSYYYPALTITHGFVYQDFSMLFNFVLQHVVTPAKYLDYVKSINGFTQAFHSLVQYLPIGLIGIRYDLVDAHKNDHAHYEYFQRVATHTQSLMTILFPPLAVSQILSVNEEAYQATLMCLFSIQSTQLLRWFVTTYQLPIRSTLLHSFITSIMRVTANDLNFDLPWHIYDHHPEYAPYAFGMCPLHAAAITGQYGEMIAETRVLMNLHYVNDHASSPVINETDLTSWLDTQFSRRITDLPLQTPPHPIYHQLSIHGNVSKYFQDTTPEQREEHYNQLVPPNDWIARINTFNTGAAALEAGIKWPNMNALASPPDAVCMADLSRHKAGFNLKDIPYDSHAIDLVKSIHESLPSHHRSPIIGMFLFIKEAFEGSTDPDLFVDTWRQSIIEPVHIVPSYHMYILWYLSFPKAKQSLTVLSSQYAQCKPVPQATFSYARIFEFMLHRILPPSHDIPVASRDFPDTIKFYNEPIMLNEYDLITIEDQQLTYLRHKYELDANDTTPNGDVVELHRTHRPLLQELSPEDATRYKAQMIDKQDELTHINTRIYSRDEIIEILEMLTVTIFADIFYKRRNDVNLTQLMGYRQVQSLIPILMICKAINYVPLHLILFIKREVPFAWTNGFLDLIDLYLSTTDIKTLYNPSTAHKVIQPLFAILAQPRLPAILPLLMRMLLPNNSPGVDLLYARPYTRSINLLSMYDVYQSNIPLYLLKTITDPLYFSSDVMEAIKLYIAHATTVGKSHSHQFNPIYTPLRHVDDKTGDRNNNNSSSSHPITEFNPLPPDIFGQTPLMIAASFGSPHLITYTNLLTGYYEPSIPYDEQNFDLVPSSVKQQCLMLRDKLGRTTLHHHAGLTMGTVIFDRADPNPLQDYLQTIITKMEDISKGYGITSHMQSLWYAQTYGQYYLGEAFNLPHFLMVSATSSLSLGLEQGLMGEKVFPFSTQLLEMAERTNYKLSSRDEALIQCYPYDTAPSTFSLYNFASTMVDAFFPSQMNNILIALFSHEKTKDSLNSTGSTSTQESLV